MLVRFLVFFALVSMFLPYHVMGHGSFNLAVLAPHCVTLTEEDKITCENEFMSDFDMDAHNDKYKSIHAGYEDYDIHHSHSTTSYDNGVTPVLTTDNWHRNANNTSHVQETGTGVFVSGKDHGAVEHVHKYYNAEEDYVSRNDCHQHKEVYPNKVGMDRYQVGSHHNPRPYSVDSDGEPRNTVNGDGHDGSSDGCGDEVVPPVTHVDTVTPVATVTNSRSETVTVIPIPTKDSVVVEEVIEEVVVEETVELVRFEYGWWYKGLNLVSFPVLPEGVETVKDLFERYQLFEPFQLISEDPFEYTGDAIYVLIDGDWLSYGGEEDNLIGDIVITPYMGFVLLMDYSSWLGVDGIRLIGDGSYELQTGVNLLGITEMPVGIKKPSDFLLIDGVIVVISRVITDLGRDKKTYVISREGDNGDEYPVALGHAYMLVSEIDGTVIEFDGDTDVPAAPAANRVGKLNTSWGSIKVK